MSKRRLTQKTTIDHPIALRLLCVAVALAALTTFALLFLLRPQPAQAAGIVGDGTPASCTEAALDAALAGGGSVTFDCGGDPATIVVTGQKVITADTTIDGGEHVIISGGNATRVFFVNTGVALTLTNLTVSGGVVTGTGGYGGGVFNNGGTLAVINSTIAQNHADRDGGGIYNTGGPLLVRHSTFFSNTASHAAGGIEIVDSAADVVNSTFSGNSAPSGGGIDTYQYLGVPPTLAVVNSTFSGNSAATGGGICNNGGTITLKNTIVANSGGANCFGTIADGGGNLQYGGSTPNSCGAAIPTGNPNLGALADNGGPTWTMALLAGSAARDAADDATCAAAPVNGFDQRGSPRPMGAHCDIGAFEYDTPQTGPIFAVNDTAGTDDGVCGSNCRLREAIHAANAYASAATVELAAGATYTLTAVDNFYNSDGGNGLPAIVGDITLNAHGATIARSQAAGTPPFRLFYVQSGGALRLNQVTLHGGMTDLSGSGIFNAGGTLIVTDSTLSDNAAGSYGGGICSEGALIVTNSTFSNNTAVVGGGIFCSGTWASIVVVNSTFSGNSATSFGGGISNMAVSDLLVVINSTFSDNSAPSGGGIHTLLTFMLMNTIVANSGGENCSGPIVDGGGNLQYGGSTPDSCGAAIPTGDPHLGALADNGGPTWTMAIPYNSAARDAANDATCANALVNNLDQRGVTRPLGAHCDVGAYETPFVHGVFLPLTLRDD